MNANVPPPSAVKRHHPWWKLGLAIVLVASGCATMSPEQAARRELLLQAAQDCQRRYPFVQRFEFDRFDRLLWYYREGTPYTERDLFGTCYKERIAELTKTAAASAAYVPPTQPRPPANAGDVTSGVTPQESWSDAPVWKVGDEWSYRWESPRGRGTFVWRVASEETVDGIDCYVIDSGRYQIYYRKSDLASVQQKDRGVLEYRNTPPRQFAVWPLQVGRMWEELYTQERPQERSTNSYLRTWRVEAKERITVPAGTFEAFKIVERDKWSNTVAVELWAASEAKGVVRADQHFSFGIDKRELTAFKLN